MPRQPNRIRQSASSPSACQKPTSGQPNSGGSSQFQSSRTISPPMNVKSAMPSRATGASINNFRLLVIMIRSSWFREFVIDVLQTPAQMQHGVTLSREQRVDAHTGDFGHLFEAAAFQLMADEDFTLLFGQLGDRCRQLIQEHAPRIDRVGSGLA